MSAEGSGFWRIHRWVCGLSLGAATVLALWLMSDPGTSIGAMLAVGAAFLAVGVALLNALISTLALVVIRRLRPGAGGWTVLGVHLVSLPLAVGTPLAWPTLEERWDRLEDQRFADCLELRSCQVSATEQMGHPAYSVVLEVESCRSMDIGANLRAQPASLTEDRIHSKSSLDMELKRGPGTIQLYAEAADPGVDRRWIVEMWERRGLSAPLLGPFGGVAEWTGFTREEVPKYGWRDDLVYRELPDCVRTSP